jgi:MFS superfamily sulfate permease-like transporter
VAGLVLAGTVALILLFLTEPIQYLPTAVLAAVIVSAGIGLVDVDAWRALWATDRVEVAIAGVTTAGVVVVGVLEALTLAVGLTIIDVVRRSARPHDAVLGWVEKLGRWGDVSIHRSARITPGVVVYRLDDRLFFANARYAKGRVREAINGAPGPTRFLVFSAEAMTYIDSTGLEALAELAQSLRDDDIQLVFARVKRWVRQELDEAGLTEAIGSDRFYPSVRAAVRACAAKLEA